MTTEYYHAVHGGVRRSPFFSPRPAFVGGGTLYASRGGLVEAVGAYHAYRLGAGSHLVYFPDEPRAAATCAHGHEIEATAIAAWEQLFPLTIAPPPPLAEKPVMTQETLDDTFTAVRFGQWLALQDNDRLFYPQDGTRCFGHAFLAATEVTPADRFRCGTRFVALLSGSGRTIGELPIRDAALVEFLQRAVRAKPMTAREGLLLWLDVLADAVAAVPR